MSPLGGGEGGSGGAEAPEKAGVAPTVSLNGTRLSEKAKVLERA